MLQNGRFSARNVVSSRRRQKWRGSCKENSEFSDPLLASADAGARRRPVAILNIRHININQADVLKNVNGGGKIEWMLQKKVNFALS